MNYIILNHYIQVYFYDRSHFLRQIILFCAFLFAGNDTNRQLRTVWDTGRAVLFPARERTKRNKDTNTVCILARSGGAEFDPPRPFLFFVRTIREIRLFYLPDLYSDLRRRRSGNIAAGPVFFVEAAAVVRPDSAGPV